MQCFVRNAVVTALTQFLLSNQNITAKYPGNFGLICQCVLSFLLQYSVDFLCNSATIKPVCSSTILCLRGQEYYRSLKFMFSAILLTCSMIQVQSILKFQENYDDGGWGYNWKPILNNFKKELKPVQRHGEDSKILFKSQFLKLGNQIFFRTRMQFHTAVDSHFKK